MYIFIFVCICIRRAGWRESTGATAKPEWHDLMNIGKYLVKIFFTLVVLPTPVSPYIYIYIYTISITYSLVLLCNFFILI